MKSAAGSVFFCFHTPGFDYVLVNPAAALLFLQISAAAAAAAVGIVFRLAMIGTGWPEQIMPAQKQPAIDKPHAGLGRGEWKGFPFSFPLIFVNS